MHVRWLELAGFRNYAALSFAPAPGLNVLVGPNGQGKTSLLEGFHVLVAGRSFRTTHLAECVAWEAGEAHVGGEVVDGERSRAVRLALQPRVGGLDVRGTLCPWGRAVTFGAADVGLLTGPPAMRRAYLDGAATKLVPAHAESCRRYRLVLRQRARLLPRLAGRGDGERLLAPWDEQVAALGSEIVHRRLETLGVLERQARALLGTLAPWAGELSLGYAGVVAPATDPAGTRAALAAALAAGRAKEIVRGLTLAGPHRDDVVIRLGRAAARGGASRGAQRLVALALRLAEAGAVRGRSGVSPVLLLDDLLSELDRTVRERVLEWVATEGQVLFSTTDVVPEARAVGTVWEIRHAAARRMGDPIRARGAA